jgi:hypothetical protein
MNTLWIFEVVLDLFMSLELIVFVGKMIPIICISSCGQKDNVKKLMSVSYFYPTFIAFNAKVDFSSRCSIVVF